MSASAAHPFVLPQTEQGKVDWNTLGNTVTRHLLEESLCVSYVDHKYGTMAEDSTATEWRFDYEKNGIVVFRKKSKYSNRVSFSGRGVVSAPYTAVAEFVKIAESAFMWDKFLVESKYVKTVAQSPTHTDYIGYQMFSAAHCFSILQRDILCFIRCMYIDGKYVQSGVSVEDEDYPPQKSRPRCDIYPGTGFVVEPYRGSSTTSLVTYFGNVDVKGLPLFLMTQALRRHPMAVQYIQRNFSNQSPQRSLSPPPPSSLSSPSPSPLTRSMLPYEDSVPLGTFMGRGGNTHVHLTPKPL